MSKKFIKYMIILVACLNCFQVYAQHEESATNETNDAVSIELTPAQSQQTAEQVNVESQAIAANEVKPTIQMVLEILGIILVMLAIFWFGLRLRAQLSGGLVQGRRSGKKLKIIDRVALGGRYYIFVIDYEGEQAMVGVSPNGMFHVKDLPGGRSEGISED